jgi:hypothetical protein
VVLPIGQAAISLGWLSGYGFSDVNDVFSDVRSFFSDVIAIFSDVNPKKSD